MFRDRADEQFSGYCGLRTIVMDGEDQVELLYAVISARWKRGLATEMARAVVRVGFESLSLAELVAFTLPTNHASQRVMQQAGLTYERDIIHVGLPHVLYRLTASAYRQQIG